MPDAVLTIDLDALAANYRTICAVAAPTPVSAVVKADGYGLGAGVVGPALHEAGCRIFFVAQVSEAVALRQHLPATAEIFVLNGIAPGDEAACLGARATPVLNCLDDIRRWQAAAVPAGEKLPAALQLDTGMSRLGLDTGSIERLADEPRLLDGLDVTLVMSHLACSDEPDHPANRQQVERFEALTARLPTARRSLANSGGTFLPRAYHFDLVRTGIALYGAAPQAGGINPMRPVASLHARIIQVRTIEAGAGVGYGLTSRADRARRIATISLGYADGWPRHLSNRGAAYIGGFRAPIAGRVSMDSICLDVTDIPEAILAAADAAELLGPHQSLEEVAADAGTIAYEILIRLGHRGQRLVIPASRPARRHVA